MSELRESGDCRRKSVEVVVREVEFSWTVSEKMAVKDVSDGIERDE